MANSSGPYKSRIVRNIVRQARRLLDHGQTTIRRAQVVASWSAQILLYPFYAAFQTGRLLGQSASAPADSVAPPPDSPLGPLSVLQTELPITAETPIYQVLQAVETFTLPERYAVDVPAPVMIRAIASLLDTQALVLVTNHNQLLAIPDPDQQHWLQQRITYELASYYREQRSRQLPLQRIVGALRGVQQAIQRRFQRTPSASVLPPGRHLLRAAFAAPEPPPDQALQQTLHALQRWLTDSIPPLPPAAPNPAIAPALTSSLPTAPTSAIAPSSRLATLRLTVYAAAEPALTSAEPDQALPAAPVRIQGVVSLVASRQLALVSTTNDVLDILTPDQQQQLQQRIAWEVAHYYRYMHLKAAAIAPSMPPLPAQRRFWLPPPQAIQRFICWMQSGPVAIATNLFREAAQLYPEDPTNAPPLASPPGQSQSSAPASTLGAIAPARSNPAQPVPIQRSALSRWLALALPRTTVPMATQPSSPTLPDTPSTSTVSGLVPSSREIMATVPSPTSTQVTAPLATTNDRELTPAHATKIESDVIDTHATAIGYEPSWLERVMGWLDQCFLWAETMVERLWQQVNPRR